VDRETGNIKIQRGQIYTENIEIYRRDRDT
jgi:hypothetical protein